MIELEEIADLRRQIITPATSVPIIGVVQDSLLGAYNLTQPTMRVEWKDAMNIISYTLIDEFSAFKKDKLYKGTELFSYIVPPKINIKKGDFVVKKGILDPEHGVLTNDMLGSKKQNSMIHLIWNEYGIEETKTFIDNIQKLVNNFNLINGFTVGIGDVDISLELEEKMNKLFETKKLEVNHLITEIENNPDLMDSDIFELSVYSELNTVRDTVSKLIMQNLKPDNNFNIMISSGSKGSPINMGQMGGCVGQQAVEGKRIQKKVNGRTLCYFHQNDDSAMARGFIERPYINGMTPTEFIFHNMSSREGLIDTAIKSVTGDTEIVIMENGVTKNVKIGDWIDDLLRKNISKVENYKDRNMELLNIKDNIYIPTTNENGVVTWETIKAITRHDPGKELYEIKTLGGRKVIVTESKSLLIWNKDKQIFEKKDTPNVLIGDFVPTTMNLPKPPYIMDYVDITKFFSKKEYLYGNDFHKACDELDKIKSDKVPENWWNINNDNKFTLPYKYAHRLKRVRRRSNIECINKDYIYQYDGIRGAGLPEKFILDKDNGKFIGLFLAEGNTDYDSGYIQITNNDNNILSFVKEWFTKFGIEYKISSKINKIGGTTTDIRGYSRLFSKFLTQILGHKAQHKFVPNFAFNANDEFIIGLLDGYISGDGTVTNNAIQVTSASKKLIEGINMLLSRFGIFGKVGLATMKSNNIGTKNILPINTLSIRGQWALLFADKITLMSKAKSIKLKEIKPSNEHRNFTEINDVVMDKIIEINKIDIVKYPKVYDLTVPSTLNFGLANGLHVVDTAESGYVQRKLIKSMEDVSVKYDCTVRNSNDAILQYIYGDSGLDTSRQYKHEIKSVLMGNTEIDNKYKFTKDELKVAKFSEDENDKYVSKLKKMRDSIRQSQIKVSMDYKVLNAQYMLPINMHRLIENTKNDTFESNDKLDAKYVLKRLDEMMEYKHTFLTCMNKAQLENKKMLKHNDEKTSKTIFKYAMHDFLAPKRCIIEYGFNKGQFDYIIDQIIKGFNMSVVEPGEMVGIIAAQSIGEPVTQMSCSRQTRIIISGACDYFGNVDDFIDPIIENNKSKLQTIAKDSVVFDLKDDYYIIGTNENGKTSWKRIKQISRHPANGKLVKVTTKSGKTTTATLTHSFLKKTETGIEPIKGSDLKIGMRIPVAKYIPQVNNTKSSIIIGSKDINLNHDFGWFCGAYIAEGRIDNGLIQISNISEQFINRVKTIAKLFDTSAKQRNYQGEYGPSTTTSFSHKDLATFIGTNFGIGSYNKKIPAFVFSSNKEFINGLLRGYFDGDGNVNGDPKRSTIRCGSRSEELIVGICILLAYNGIFASKLQEKKMYKGEEKILHTLCIPKKYAKVYKENIGTNMEDKLKALNEMIEWNDREDGSTQDNSDKIPAIGNIIARLGKELNLPGQSRTYGRWAKKESIGKRTLDKYIDIFADEIDNQNRKDLQQQLQLLKDASDSNLVWDEIVQLDILNDPKEYVYDFTVPGNDSFMVDCAVLVHNTLNSIDWKEKIIIKENGKTRIVKIGEFTDDAMKNNNNVEFYGDIKDKEMNDTYYLNISDKRIFAPSVDENGKIQWKKVIALTKHLPINNDGTRSLVEVKTKLGRTTTATKAKSFLTRKDNKIVAIRGDEIKKGMYIPIVEKMPEFDIVNEINISDYFSKDKYIYGSELKKAREFKEKQNASGIKSWFKEYNGNKFTTPYKRQDSLNDVFKGRNSKEYIDGAVYPIHGNKNSKAEFPEIMKLDRLSGFFFGSYLAEGLATKNYIAIANNDEKYRNEIIKFCDRYKFGYHIQKQENKIKEGWTSTDIRIHSRLLATFVELVCNTGSDKKIVPEFAYDANNEFIVGLLDGYFSGDGRVCTKTYAITACSVSKDLLIGISLLLTRFSVVSKISKPNKIMSNNRGSQNIKQHYTLYIGSGHNRRFAEKISLIIDHKQKELDNMLSTHMVYKYGYHDVVPNVKLSSGNYTISRDKLEKINGTDNDMKIIETALVADVFYDEVIYIGEVEASKKYVYDLTVEDNKTFTLFNGLTMMDTFHSAGIGSKGTTALGVPRVKELLSFSKNLKTPLMQIYLDKKYMKDKDMANKIASYIKYTTIEHLRKRIDVYYDPNPFNKGSFMDKDNVKNIFHSHNPGKYSCQSDITSIPWLMRIELDREKMMSKEVTLLDIKSKFCNFWEKRYNNMKGLKKEERLLLDKVTQCAVLSNNDNDSTPIIHLRFDMNNFDFGTIVNFSTVFVDNFKLKGLNGIDDIHGTPEERLVRADNKDQEIVVDKEYVIYTNGVNLKDIRYINGIDFRRTICNDVVQIYESYGIEAARAALLREIKIVLQGAGNFVNFQHLSILVDVMTSSGSLISIDRHGINKLDTNPFARASFEKTVDQFISAAVFSEKDSMNSVSSRIMAGLVIKGGTGACNIKLDTQLLEKSEFTEDLEEKYTKSFTGVSQDPVIKEVVENKDDGDIFMPE